MGEIIINPKLMNIDDTTDVTMTHQLGLKLEP